MLELGLSITAVRPGDDPGSTPAVELADDDGTTYLTDDDDTTYLTDD